ncbi:NnrUfamily protein [Rippkaea orientalis PCC 8801]|uniref:NnrUfamily protein n=1 Tax=Rippkaea orientalis (strain PCC 8801 / RF-1) TaxID=41431 RepID=B7JVJ5_RIPO1|nr:NnrU family protein [Rippkaea orientalis]ACK64566.1 NnrUfamily protein [Rippkaea orientalis PCC 8801]
MILIPAPYLFLSELSFITLSGVPTWLTPSHGVILGLLLGFAIAHSGLAALRFWGESKIGARLYRVLFALVSIPLAVILITYFFNHRYDGLILWQVQDVWGVKQIVWGLSAISFLFLYPATFNLLEIAAIAKPQVHLYETGILRVCRHPQMVGQVIWCIAHTLWIGTTFTLITSLGLIAHHLFAVWHGDYRLQKRYGDAFIAVKERTSIIPFLAILDGRQTFKGEELIKPAYLGVLVFVGLLWWGHPWLLQITAQVPW